MSVFRIFDTRSGSCAKTLLGETYSGIVGTDRFSGYAWIDPSHRQICWAHLKRDLQALVERGDESRIVGQMLLSRLNLTIRQCVSKLTRRTWGPARYMPELMEHLEWWCSYYHFVRPHESLAVELFKPVTRKGRQLPRKYRRRPG